MPIPRSLARLVLVTVLGVAGLTGCAAESSAEKLPSNALSPSPTVSDSAALEPTATPSASAASEIDLDDPTTWLIDSQGVGPVRLGETITAARSDLRAFAEETTQQCPTVFFTTPAGTEIWLIPEVGTDFVGLVISINTYHIDVPELARASAPLTTSGIGVGSTTDDLFAAYPAIFSTTPPEIIDPDHEAWAVADGVNFLNFGTTDGFVRVIVVSHEPVLWPEFCG